MEPQACTAQVLCQPICRFRGVYGLESHMAVGPAGASTLLLSSKQDKINEFTHLHEEQHVFPRSAQSFSQLLHQLAYRPEPQTLARIRTLARSLHPAVDPAPPPPSAAAA